MPEKKFISKLQMKYQLLDSFMISSNLSLDSRFAWWREKARFQN